MTSEVMIGSFILEPAPAGNTSRMGRLPRAVARLHHFRFPSQEQPEIQTAFPKLHGQRGPSRTKFTPGILEETPTRKDGEGPRIGS